MYLHIRIVILRCFEVFDLLNQPGNLLGGERINVPTNFYLCLLHTTLLIFYHIKSKKREKRIE